MWEASGLYGDIPTPALAHDVLSQLAGAALATKNGIYAVSTFETD